MGLSLERKTILTARSDRVKCVDLHPSEPWMLVSLYGGVVTIWNYETNSIIKSVEVSDMPVRCAKFIARKNWFITGTDDLIIRVYNYNTMEKVTQFEGHSDYIRSFAIHPARPFVLSSSDDMTVKLWDWEKSWKCITTFEGHSHYVMAVTFNPKDSNTFATASLDCSIKIWNISSSTASYTLEGHDKGVNCIDFYHGADKPYLITGADDSKIKIWDYQTKACIRTLDGHSQNVSSVMFHPDLPIILSGSEDGNIKIWSLKTFRLESSFNFSLDRIWSLALRKGFTEIAVGCDEGSVIFQLGKGHPAATMEGNSGKVVWAKNSQLFSGNILQSLEEEVASNVPLHFESKDLGNCDVYPQSIEFSPSGRFAAVCGDGEYIIYSTLAWRNKAFGKGLEFVWSLDNNYSVRENASKISIFTDFSETGVIKIATGIERIFGGPLIATAGSDGQLSFFDWNTTSLISRFDVSAKSVIWSEDASQVAILAEDVIYILKYNAAEVANAINQNLIDEEGLNEAFDFITEVNQTATSGRWIEDSFVFTSPMGSGSKICYIVGDQVHQVAFSEKTMFIAGYSAQSGKIVCFDRDATVYSFALSLPVIKLENSLLKRDLPGAKALLPLVPAEQLNKVGQFAASLGYPDFALSFVTDLELKFDLAVHLRKLELAYEIALNSDSKLKWQQLGDLALKEWKIALAEKCFLECHDLESLLLLYSGSNNIPRLLELAEKAIQKHKFNVAFSCFFAAGKREECFEMLISKERYPEAALFARTYLPSYIDRAVKLWREFLINSGRSRMASFIASPLNNPECFPEHEESISKVNTVSQGHSLTSYNTPHTDDHYFSPSKNTEAFSFKSNLSQPSPAYGSASETAASDHMSMDVNTGTLSMRADDMDDLASVTISDYNKDEAVLPTRQFESMCIHEELEEEVEIDDEDNHGELSIDIDEGFKTPQEVTRSDIGETADNVNVGKEEIYFEDEEGWD